MPRHPRNSVIALTGFMGSGKSSVGKALASLLGWRCVDLDSEIEREQGRKIREIFASEGEARFREIEAATLRAVLANVNRRVVLAMGGGTFVQAANAELLRGQHALVVFLEASPETLLKRCFSEDGLRPLARDREAFLRLYEERLPFYRAADLTVDSDRKHPLEVAREIANALGLDVCRP